MPDLIYSNTVSMNEKEAKQCFYIIAVTFNFIRVFKKFW
jgi:hypothetical protein